ncbi:MAG: DUF1178 family protein [Ferrovibrio sp.]|uniref:DUF1178 family protein n=1 Tax=Ferrovibrio sp. TaxID=1917215 RepID=UPI00263518B3|nr:DUF1178 family protein [Ferrovibrio sp.]MCW0233474.1 DUF1178 family protein [Ferrovibrio sp.]
MIKYELKCRKDHVFEAWFYDSATYDKQEAGGKVVCPVCNSRKVTRAPMAPRIGKSKSQVAAAEAKQQAMALKALAEIRDHVEKNADYVGDQFAEEARKIHYGEVDKRSIYGEATREEAEDLAEEGVDVAMIPWLPRGDA